MRIRILLVSLCSVLLMALWSMPSHALSKKELEAQNIQLSQRLNALENRMLTGDPAAERLMQRMDTLEASQRALTGQVERLVFERDSLQEEVRALAGQIASMQILSEEMKLHLKAVEAIANQPQISPRAPIVYGELQQGQDSLQGSVLGGGVYADGSSFPPPPVILGGGANAQIGNDVSKLAEIGQEQMLEGDIGGAQTSFLQYLQMNPGAKDRGDIYYWLGETYYVKGGYPKAIDAFVESMRIAPKGAFAPDAMIKLAASANALGNKDMACKTLASFPAQYPKASARAKEKARIERDRTGC